MRNATFSQDEFNEKKKPPIKNVNLREPKKRKLKNSSLKSRKTTEQTRYFQALGERNSIRTERGVRVDDRCKRRNHLQMQEKNPGGLRSMPYRLQAAALYSCCCALRGFWRRVDSENRCESTQHAILGRIGSSWAMTHFYRRSLSTLSNIVINLNRIGNGNPIMIENWLIDWVDRANYIDHDGINGYGSLR